ncbi:hypothetical protein SAMN02990966_07284 [Rhodospirillales bacterium URHD0017]|nr:hypothetical protein SAMN02990966_07284 [Rhodospirillales bacterium URHD0017]
MNVLAQFIDADLLLQLDEREVRALGAIIDAEITGNPNVRKAIAERLAGIMPKLGKSPRSK